MQSGPQILISEANVAPPFSHVVVYHEPGRVDNTLMDALDQVAQVTHSSKNHGANLLHPYLTNKLATTKQH